MISMATQIKALAACHKALIAERKAANEKQAENAAKKSVKVSKPKTH